MRPDTESVRSGVIFVAIRWLYFISFSLRSIWSEGGVFCGSTKDIEIQCFSILSCHKVRVIYRSPCNRVRVVYCDFVTELG